MVHWDQRGAGKTYGRHGAATSEVSLKRIVDDGIEVTEHLRRALGKHRIVVLGHSWGSIVAVNMAQKRPDLYAAYVGTGQVASWDAVVRTQFAALRAKAARDGDAATLAQLDKIGAPDPKNLAQYFSYNRKVEAAMPQPDQDWLKHIRAFTAASLGVPQKDLDDLGAGMSFTIQRVLGDMVATDLPLTAARLDIPTFLIQGADDITTPTTAAVAYFDSIKAPKKNLTVIKGAGHFAFMTHTAPFLAALEKKVRPTAVSRGA